MAEFREGGDKFNSLFAYLFDVVNGGPRGFGESVYLYFNPPTQGGRNEMLILWIPETVLFSAISIQVNAPL